MPLYIKRLTKTAVLPTRAHTDDAGLDLYADAPITVPAGDRALVPTGIAIAVPPAHVGLIWPRSGMAWKQGIDVGAGVVDCGYRGEVKVLLFNHDAFPLRIQAGDKVAQLLIQVVASPHAEEVAELPDSGRGENGFGSSGR